MSDEARRRTRVANLSAAQRNELFDRLLQGRQRTGIPRLNASQAPLSFAQQRLWFLQQFDPDTTAFNLHFALRIEGALDVDAFRQSLGDMVARHEILRTTLEVHSGDAVQMVHESADVDVAIVNLGGLTAEAQEDEIRALGVADSLRPFDFTVAPLLRCTLLRLGPAEHVVLLALPHVAADGWSLGVFVTEFQSAYRARAAGVPVDLPALPIQYADYAAWQRDTDDGAIAGHLEYWRGWLDTDAPPLDLPADRPRPARQTFNGATLSFAVPAPTVDGLRQLAAGSDATLFMVLLTGFGALLSRYTGRPDITVGMPVANRARPELEPLIGMFVNTLVIKSDLGGNPRFADAVRHVRDVALAAFDHQDVPFERLVEEMQPPRDLSRTPLFQVMFILQNMPRPSFHVEGLSTTLIEIDNGTAKYDITVELTEADGRLHVAIEYNTDLFDADRIERMADHFVRLLGSAAEDPGRRLSELELISDDERRRMLVGWNATATNPQRAELRVHELISRQAAATPDAVAGRCGPDSITYADLDAQSNAVAGALLARGIAREDIVAVLAERGIPYLIALLGILKAGAAYLPVEPDQPVARMRQVVDGSACRFVVVGPAVGDVFTAPPIPIDELLAGDTTAPVAVPVDGSALAYVLFTSGSTGVPKGAMVEHDGMSNHIQAKIDALEIDGTSVVAQNGPQSFDVSVWQFLAALTCGGTVVVFSDEVAHDPGRLLEETEAAGVTVLQIVPSVLREMVRVARERGNARPSLAALRHLVPTGDALSAPLCAAWFELYPSIPILNTYGSTECSDDQCHIVVPTPEALVGSPPIVSIGRPIRNMQAYVLDADLEPAPIGVPGELYIGGVGVGRGYLHDPRRTAEVFVPDPFSPSPGGRLYRTRDHARYLDDGSLEFLGRRDHLLKIHGLRVEPGEIEAALTRHPKVDAAVVVAVGEGEERRLVAYLEAPGADAGLVGDVRALAREQLPVPMIPSTMVLLDELPINANGKVDRAQLPAVDSGAGRAAFRTPGSETERYLAALWDELLDAERVGLDDNFFHLGGHSLVATRVVARVRRDLAVDVPVRLLFETDTLAELSAVVDALASVQEEAALTVLLDELDEMSDDEVAEHLRRT